MKTRKQKKSHNEESDSLHTIINLPFYERLAPYLTAKETQVLSSTCQIFHNLCNDHLVWRHRYLADFGKLYFNEDYKEQYIAEYMRQQTMKSDKPEKKEDYNTLCAYIQYFSNKPWAPFYLSLTTSNFVDYTQYCLTALERGDSRGGVSLASYFYLLPIPFFMQIYKPIVDALISASNLDHYQDAYDFLSLVNCLLLKMTNNPTEKAEFKDRALKALISSLDINNKNVNDFIPFSMIVFESIDAINLQRANSMQTNTKIRHTPNVLEVVISYIDRAEMFNKATLSALVDWIYKLAESGNATAAYCYADYRRKSLLRSMMLHSDDLHFTEIKNEIEIAKLHYINAIKGGEYRAVCSDLSGGIGGLYSLMGIRDDAEIVSQTDWNHMLREGIAHGDQNCLITMAARCRAHKGWHKDPFNMWVLQLAACINDDYGRDSYHFLMSKSQYPETHPFIYCALGLVYQLRDADTKKSEHMLNFANAVDPTLHGRYIAAGKKYGLCSPLHETTIARFVKPVVVEVPKEESCVEHRMQF